MTTQKDLKKRILEEMTTEYSNALQKNFDLAKQFIRITKDGKVDILIKDNLNGQEQILLYLIGKLYAKEAGYAATDDVKNQELMDELGFPEGSLYPWIKNLYDKKMIKTIKKGRYVIHNIQVNFIEKTLKNIERKIKKTI